ncbi:MAG: pentapeptide repeat-containing protein [Bradymonadia bacterium]
MPAIDEKTQRRLEEILGHALPKTASGALDLRDADLREAELEDAHLQGAHLQKADFQDAHLNCANLQAAQLRGADFQYADLSDVDFRGADLRDAGFEDADIQEADFRGAHLTGATGLPDWVMRGLDSAGRFTLTQLVSAIRSGFGELSGANLREADLRGVALQHADLWGANLQGAIRSAEDLVPEGWTAQPRSDDPDSVSLHRAS